MSTLKLEEIKAIAQQHNIKAGKMKKSELVRAIQSAEGNEPCFEAGRTEVCGQMSCSWREMCS